MNLSQEIDAMVDRFSCSEYVSPDDVQAILLRCKSALARCERDLAAPNFDYAKAAAYARKMGLPTDFPDAALASEKEK